MRRQISLVAVLVAALLLAVTLPAGATLVTFGTADIGGVGTGYNLIYDSDSPFGPIVWLDYTQDYNSWANQVTWAGGLNNTGVITYHIDPSKYQVTWDGTWRLPATLDSPLVWGYDGTTPGGVNITTSELGHLYYTELGNLGCYDTSGNYQAGWWLILTGDFNNLIAGWYWSGTEYANFPGYAWYFVTNGGIQYAFFKDDSNCALAVRPGQVVATPEPSTLLLVGGGLAALVLVRRRHKNH